MAEKFLYPQDCVWSQRDGTRIKLGEMTDTHLMNTHKLLMRQVDRHYGEAEAALCYSGNPDSMGSYYADQAMSQSLDVASQYAERARVVLDELKRRYPDEQSVRSYVERLSGRRVQRRAAG